MSDESFDSLFSEFIELFDHDKLTIMQKYQPVIFYNKNFQQKKRCKVSIFVRSLFARNSSAEMLYCFSFVSILSPGYESNQQKKCLLKTATTLPKNIFIAQTCRVDLLPTMLKETTKIMSLITGFILIFYFNHLRFLSELCVEFDFKKRVGCPLEFITLVMRTPGLISINRSYFFCVKNFKD